MAFPGPQGLGKEDPGTQLPRAGPGHGLFPVGEFSNPKGLDPKGAERRCGSSQQSQAQDGGGDTDLKFRWWRGGGGSPLVGLACLGGWRGLPGH